MSPESLQTIIANAREVTGIVRRRAERLDVTLAQIAQILQNRAEQADDVAREFLDRSRTQILTAERLMGDLVRRIEYATEEAERIVKKPFHGAHALITGLRAALGCLFSCSRSRTNRRNVEQHEAMVAELSVPLSTPVLLQCRKTDGKPAVAPSLMSTVFVLPISRQWLRGAHESAAGRNTTAKEVSTLAGLQYQILGAS